MAKLPDNPNTRLERYLARLAGQDVSIPDTPITRIECYLAYLIENGGGAAAPNAGGHNSVFRGKNLGATFTEAQVNAIDSGTFEDIFIGDYWEKDGVKYRVAAFDYFLNNGTPAVMTSHHAVVVPDTSLYTYRMNDTDSTATGYRGSVMFSAGLTDALTQIRGIFNGNLLRIPLLTTITATGNDATDWRWDGSRYISIMNESMLYSSPMWGTQVHSPYNSGNCSSQLPLFAMRPDLINTRESYWLSDIVSSTSFSSHMVQGRPGNTVASTALGVRPFIMVGKATA